MRKLGIFVAIILSLTAAAGLSAAEERLLEYDWLTIGKPSGQQSAYYSKDGTIIINFSFNDRGRGPETRTIVKLNAAGVPVALHIRGLNYMKAGVDERFSIMYGKAVWASKIEHQQSDFNGQAFYVANNAPPELLAIQARAILAREDGVLPLLPTGNARIRRLTSETLQGDTGETTITLYAMTGFGPDPEYIWLDQDQEFFGVDYNWFAIMRKGWSKHLPVLKTAQTKARDAHVAALSRKLSHPIEGLLVIRGARIFDSIKGKLTKERTVFVEDGKITAVKKGRAKVPQGARVIDAAGMTLMPALWDMHGHISPSNYLNYLASGVTNVRDMANDPEFIVRARADLLAGRVAGPDIHAMGFIDKKSPFAAPTGMLAETLEEALGFVDYYAERGFLGIKLYSSIEPEWVPAIVEKAHGLGLTVLGHIPAYMTAEEAVLAGFDEITHVNMLLLNFLGAKELDTRTPLRFTVPGKEAGKLDLASDEVTAFIRLLKEKGVAHDPTMSIFMDMFLNTPGQVTPIFSEIVDHFPASTRRQMIAGTGFNEGHEEAFAEAAETVRHLIRLLHENGIRLLPGTDNALPGFTLLRELRFYVEAGIPVAAALQSATIEAARHLGLEESLGSVAPGKLAQLVLINGDPTKDIGDLYKVVLVIKEDKMFRPAEILEEQGFEPFE